MCKCPWKLEDDEGPDILKNRNVTGATVHCFDNRFQGFNISTCAVRCDGRVECKDGRDELGCQENKTIFRAIVGCIVIVFVITSILAVHKLAPRIQKKIDSGPASYIELVEPLMNYETTEKLIHLICNIDQGIFNLNALYLQW